MTTSFAPACRQINAHAQNLIILHFINRTISINKNYIDQITTSFSQVSVIKNLLKSQGD